MRCVISVNWTMLPQPGTIPAAPGMTVLPNGQPGPGATGPGVAGPAPIGSAGIGGA